MDKIIDSVMTVSANKSLSDEVYDKQMSHIVQSLNKIGANHLVASPGGVDLLDACSPSEHSIAYLYIMLANIRAKSLEHSLLWERAVNFLRVYDARQISFAQDQFKNLVEEILRFVRGIGKPILAVRPLKNALLRSANPTRFSSLHTWFLQICLEAKCYHDASIILRSSISDIPLKKECKDMYYQDVMAFFLFAGMVYVGLKDWSAAQQFFGYVIAFPGGACSTLQVEAYKKYVLVGLLLEGKLVNPPTGTTTAVLRAFRILAKPYESFAHTFASRNSNALRSLINACAPIFTEDGNTGLANQCLVVFKRCCITNLTNTYVTLSVNEIHRRDIDVSSTHGDLSSLEYSLLGMIERREISATLFHDSPGTPNPRCFVEFHNDPPAEKDILLKLEHQITQIVNLTAQSRAMERTLGLTKQFIQHLTKSGKGGRISSNWSMFPGDPDAMDTVDVYDRLQRGSTGFGFDELGDEDVMVQDSFDEEY